MPHFIIFDNDCSFEIQTIKYKQKVRILKNKQTLQRLTKAKVDENE